MVGQIPGQHFTGYAPDGGLRLLNQRRVLG